ncbi:MAG: GH92 family glycosyl hydrolase, partial [Tepidisphaeraceae bacterium]
SKRTVYFVLQASRPWSQAAFEAEGKPAEGKASEGKLGEGKNTEQNGAKGKKIRAALDFPADQAPLVLRIGLSAVSVEAARKNLEAEVKGFDFDAVRDEARRQWEENLSRITITTPNPTVKRTFYSALYHTMLAPTLYNDADGSYRGGDDKVHTGGGFDNYSTFSLWDTFRAEHPLLTVIEPERVNDFVRSSLAFYAQSPAHALPRWQLAKSETNCMIGYHAMPVIYDAYAKGFRDYDANLALQAMQDSALKARNCPDDYEKLGYVASLPPKNRQAASRTLEYSYDDWCIAQMATALGKKDVADHFAKRSQYFLNLFDPSTGFFRGRTANGAWTEHFDPKAVDFNNYTEANAWQYTFFAPHDLPALLKLYGREGFIQKLDECFNQESDIHHAASDVTGLVGQYSHGNEPCHNMAYLYALAGAQDKTAWHVREIMRLLYDDTPEGLCGNDDCGQMSAWYVWSAIGLYPANPADGRYVIGSPMVPSATIRLNPKYASAKTFTIVAKDVSAQNLYVKSATLNGKPLDRPWVTHDEIMHGGTLQLQMSMLPTRLWADKTP